MSGPIDTDTFVTSDLELGIDATTLNPIQEEEDTVKNDDELSLVQQGSLDHIQANVQQGDLLTSNHNIMRNSGSFGSSTVVKSSSQGSMNENTNSSFLMEEEEGRDEDEKSDATRGHDSIDIKVGDDDGDAATASVGHPGDDHQHGLRGRSEEENDQEFFTTSDVKDSDSFEIVGHGEVWSNQEDLTETNEKEEDGEMNNAAAPVLDDVPARSVDDGDSDQKAVVAILDADENDELVLTDANGIAADTQVVADEIETLQEDAVPDAFEYSEVDDALAPLIQDGVGAETAKVATDGEVVNEKMQTIIHDEQVPFEAVLDTVPDAPEDDAIFTEHDTDGKVTAEEVELEMDDQVDAEAVDALVEDHVNNVDGVEEQVAVEVSDALVEDMEEIKTSDIGHVEHPEDNQHIAEKVENSDEKQLAVESIDTPIIDVVDHNEAVEENPMDDEVADIVVLDKTQDENNAPAAEVVTADAAITEEAELLDEPQIAGDETVDAPVDKIIDANEALVENPINDAPVAEAIAKDDAPVDYAVNADEALVDIPVDENIAEVIVEDITQDEIDGPTAEVTPSYDAATEDAELQNEPRVFDDSVDAPIDYTIDSDEALVENLVDDDSAHMAIEGITQDENDDAAEEVSTADDAAVDVEEHQDDPQVADESVDAPIDYAIGADEALVENPIDDNVAEVAVEDTTQDENDVAAAELSTADDAVTEEAELQDEPQVADEIADTLVDDVINADEALVENPVDDNIAKVVVEDITQYENDVAAAEVSTAEDDAVVDVEELQDEPHVADDIVESPVDDVIDANEVADDALIDILVDDDVAEAVVEDTTEVENNVAAVEVVTVDDAIVDIEEQQDEPQVVYETDEAPVDDVIDANEVAVEDITQEENDVDAAEVTPSYHAVTEEAELKDELHVPEEIVDTSADEAIDTDEALVENPVGDNVTEVAVEVSTDDNGNVPSAEVVTADDAVTDEIEQQNEPQAEEIVDALQDDAIDPYEALVDVPVDEVVVEHTTQDVNDVAAAEVSTAEDAVTEEAELQDDPQVDDDIADAPADDFIYTDEALVDIPVDDVVTEIVVEDTTDNENYVAAAEVVAILDDTAVDVEEQQDDPQVDDDIVESPADDAVDTDEALGDIPVDDDVAEVAVEDTTDNENDVAAAEVAILDDAAIDVEEQQDDPQVADEVIDAPIEDALSADEVVLENPIDDAVAQIDVEDTLENDSKVAEAEVVTAEVAVIEEYDQQDELQVADEGADALVDYALSADETLVDVPVDQDVAEFAVLDNIHDANFVFPAEVTPADMAELQDELQVADEGVDAPEDDAIDADEAAAENHVDGDFADEEIIQDANDTATAEVVTADDAVIEEVEQQDEPQVSDENVDALVDDDIDDDAIPSHKPVNHDRAEAVILDITQDENNVAAAEVVTADDALTEEAEQQDKPQVAFEGLDAPMDDTIIYNKTLVDAPSDDYVAVGDITEDENDAPAAGVTPAADAVTEEGELLDEPQVAVVADAPVEVALDDELITEEAEQQDELQVANQVVDVPVGDVINDEDKTLVENPLDDVAAVSVEDIDQDEKQVLLEENNEVAGGEQSDILDKNALVVSTAATAALGVSYAATNVVSNDEEGKNNETELGGESQLLMEARADGSEINYDDIAEKVSDKDVELPAEYLIVSTQGNTKAPSDANVTNNDDTTKATLVPTGITNTSDIKGVAPSSGKKPPTARSTSVSKSSSSKYRDQPKITTFASSKIRVSTSVDEYQFKATKASAPVNNNARTPSRNKRSSSSSVSKRKSSQYLDQPKTTTFSSAKIRATKSADEYTTSKYTVSSSESRSASRSNQRSSSRSMSRSSSCGRTIHIQLYERSLAQQEEGKKRRHQVEEYLSWRDAERSGKLASCTGDFDRLQHHRTLNNFRRESFREEFLRPKKKISLDEAEQLYQRLLAHKLKIEERRKQLKEEREMREIQWFKEKFQRKIPLEEATRLYYNETALTRSRSRGRA